MISDKSSKIGNVFSSKKYLNLTKESTEDYFDIVKELNIVDPESLSKEDLSVILRRIDDYDGFYSTQQLENVNYNDFSEHVFFDSAVNKVAYAFDRLSDFPYDKDEVEVLKYFNKTDGYTNHLLKNIFPKSLGHSNFSGSERIVVYDQKGKILNDIKNSQKQVGYLSPDDQKFSFDFWLHVEPTNITANHLLFKKINLEENNHSGFLCFVDKTLETHYNLNFVILNEGNYSLSSAKIEFQGWHNIVISINEKKGFKSVSFIVNGNIVNNSDITVSGSFLKHTSFNSNLKKISIPFVIGGVFIPNSQMTSASNNLNILLDDLNLTFTGFIGKIDEFRYFNKIRSTKEIKKYYNRNIFAQRGLKLYLKMNEPSGNHTNSFVTMDSSGNKLHGVVYVTNDNTNFTVLQDTTGFRINTSSALSKERLVDSPVINFSYTKTIEIRKKLIDQAKQYDEENPNLIFNLMPKHYFLEASDFQSLPIFSSQEAYAALASVVSEDGFSINKNGETGQINTDIPKNTEIVNIALIWARFFDQLKLYISSISNLLNLNYDTINNKSIIGMQVPILCKMYGIDFKEIFPTITKDKLNNHNLNYEDIISDISIRKIQNILWQRFLINSQGFIRSKGTIRSIKSSFRSFGIDFEKYIEIKEYSSFNDIRQKNDFKFIENSFNCLDFGNKEMIGKSSIFPDDDSTNNFSLNKVYFLLENIKTPINKNSDNVVLQDSFTLGFDKDWTIETFFNFKPTIKDKEITGTQLYNSKQCLLKINSNDYLSLIVRYESYTNTKANLGKIVALIYPIKNNSSYNIQLEILDVNIFDLPKYFSISQETDFTTNSITYSMRIQDIGNHVELKQQLSSSQTISDITNRDIYNVITKDLRTIVETDKNLSFYENKVDISIGSFKYANEGMLSYTISDDDLDTDFQGQIFKIRGWNKKLTNQEIISHSDNIKNVGIDSNKIDNKVIFDVDFFDAGSTLDVVESIRCFYPRDNSLNFYLNEENNNLEPLNKSVIKTRDLITDIFEIKSLICKKNNIVLDSPSNYNKVNIVSFKDEKNKQLKNNFTSFPANDLPVDFKTDTSNRISVDMSIAKVLNDDISNLISDLNSFNQTISNGQTRYQYNYKDLETIRESYFSKYSDKENINYTSIINIFKFFDNIMSSILYDIVPSHVKFEGFNLVYESHVLERHKYTYKNKFTNYSINDYTNNHSYSRKPVLQRRNLSYNLDRKLKER